MATTKKDVNSSSDKAISEVSVNETVSKETEEAMETSPIVSYTAKKKIPMDARVMVKNTTGGELIYVSKRLLGYTEVWSEFGEEIPMEMSELYSMKNTDRRFFIENWIEVDPIVLRDLNMEQFYKNFLPVDEIQKLSNKSIDEIISAINYMKPSAKNAFVLEAIKYVENGELSDIRVITAIEKTLNCELYER